MFSVIPGWKRQAIKKGTMRYSISAALKYGEDYLLLFEP